MVKEERFWEIADSVKRRLFDRLRKETRSIDYLDFKTYRKRFEEDVFKVILQEWDEIRRKYANVVSLDRLEGFLYESLFYYACLKTQTIFLDAEIIEMDEHTFSEYPPWFEATPLYDIIPDLHYIWKGRKRERKVPQVKADFIVSYVNSEGPSPPALVDVKKSSKFLKRKEVWKSFGWQITSAMRRGFIFQVAYPKHETIYPTSLRDWEVKTPCVKCRKLSDNYGQCPECGTEIFPFTVLDARYTLKNLIEKIGMSYKGRF